SGGVHLRSGHAVDSAARSGSINIGTGASGNASGDIRLSTGESPTPGSIKLLSGHASSSESGDIELHTLDGDDALSSTRRAGGIRLRTSAPNRHLESRIEQVPGLVTIGVVHAGLTRAGSHRAQEGPSIRISATHAGDDEVRISGGASPQALGVRIDAADNAASQNAAVTLAAFGAGTLTLGPQSGVAVNSTASVPVAVSSAQGVTISGASDTVLSVSAAGAGPTAKPLLQVTKVAVVSGVPLSAPALLIPADERHKTDVRPVDSEDILQKLQKLQVRQFSVIRQASNFDSAVLSHDVRRGLLAQEVAKILPEYVHTADGSPFSAATDNDALTVDHQRITVDILAALQAHSRRLSLAHTSPEETNSVVISTANAALGLARTSGAVRIVSGNSSSGDSGDVDLATGIAFGDTGTLQLRTGSSVSGRAGAYQVRVGTSYASPGSPVHIVAGGSGASNGGDASLFSGETSHPDSSTGTVRIRSASSDASTSANVASGQVHIGSGDANSFSGMVSMTSGSAAGESGTVKVQSGSSSKSASGDVVIETGEGGAGVGRVSIQTGDARGQGKHHNSGDVLLKTGSSAAGAAGSLLMETGDGPQGGGHIVVRTGSKSSTSLGDVNIEAASLTSKTGRVSLISNRRIDGSSASLSLGTNAPYEDARVSVAVSKATRGAKLHIDDSSSRIETFSKEASGAFARLSTKLTGSELDTPSVVIRTGRKGRAGAILLSNEVIEEEKQDVSYSVKDRSSQLSMSADGVSLQSAVGQGVNITAAGGVHSGSLVLQTMPGVEASGSIVLRVGATMSGKSGNVSLTAGSSNATGAGSVQILAGSAGSGAGGLASLQAGTSSTGIGGDLRLTSGAGVSSGSAQLVTSDSHDAAGALLLASGSSMYGAAGVVSIAAGATHGRSNGADVSITAGRSTADGQSSGSVMLRSGEASGNSATSGSVVLESGRSESGGSGDMRIQSGQGVHRSGRVTIASGDESLNTGTIHLSSGIANVTSGAVRLSTGRAKESSGEVTLKTGDARFDSGGALLQTGDSTAKASGAVNILSGKGAERSGNVSLSTSSAITSGSVLINAGQGQSRGGNVEMRAGASPTHPGAVILQAGVRTTAARERDAGQRRLGSAGIAGGLLCRRLGGGKSHQARSRRHRRGADRRACDRRRHAAAAVAGARR
ncbi:MAG: tail fiber domain-containing protein, partial [Methanosarcinales archaeon]